MRDSFQGGPESELNAAIARIRVSDSRRETRRGHRAPRLARKRLNGAPFNLQGRNSPSAAISRNGGAWPGRGPIVGRTIVHVGRSRPQANTARQLPLTWL